MTTNQWALYGYLEQKAKEGNKDYISKRTIANQLRTYYFDDKASRNCTDMEADVNAINSSDEVFKIIVSSSKGYKIGTLEEVNEYLHRRREQEKKSRMLSDKIERKAELNGQLRITTGKYEKPIVEAFIEK